MHSLGLYRQISFFFFCISSFDAKTSWYAKNHENAGHSMCHPLPGFTLDGLLNCRKSIRPHDLTVIVVASQSKGSEFKSRCGQDFVIL